MLTVENLTYAFFAYIRLVHPPLQLMVEISTALKFYVALWIYNYLTRLKLLLIQLVAVSSKNCLTAS